MNVNYGAYRLLSYTAPVASERPLTLKSVRQDARALKQQYREPAAAPAFSLPGLGSLLGRLFDWLGGPGTSPVPPPAPTRGKTRFVVSSFNILGSNHTRGQNSRYEPGVVRIRQAAQLLEAKRVDVVGMQELQFDQAKEFERVAGDRFGLYPGSANGRFGGTVSIAWRKDTWDLVSAETVPMPFLNGMTRHSPVVRLRNKQTGQEVYFTNFHNAANRPGTNQQRHRDAATDRQIALIQRLKRESGLPVIVTGDMNEKENYRRRMTQEGGMTPANQGRVGIDWIFGSDGVTFEGFKRDRSGLVAKTTDHPMLTSRVEIGT